MTFLRKQEGNFKNSFYLRFDQCGLDSPPPSLSAVYIYGKLSGSVQKILLVTLQV